MKKSVNIIALALTIAVIVAVLSIFYIYVYREQPYLADESEIQRTIENDYFPGVSFPIYGPGGASYSIYGGESPSRAGRYAVFLEYHSLEGLELGRKRIKNMSSTRPIIFYDKADIKEGLAELNLRADQNPYEVVLVKSHIFK